MTSELLVKSTGLVFAEKPSIGIEPTRLFDSSRFGNHGVHTDITMVQLPSGLWVRSFNGTSSYVDLGSNVSVKNFSALTILFWLKAIAAVNTDTVLDTGYWTADYGVYIPIGPDSSTIFFRIRNSAGTVVSRTSTITDNVWTQFGIVWSGALFTAITNGAAGTAVACTGSVTSSQNPLFGRRADQALDYLPGDLARPKIFNYALSPAQIRAIFQAERHWFGV